MLRNNFTIRWLFRCFSQQQKTPAVNIPSKLMGSAVSQMSVRHRKALQKSWQRGMKETDLLLGSWANKHLPNMSNENLLKYENILNEEDPDLYKYLSGTLNYPPHLDKDMMEALKTHARDYGKTIFHKNNQ